MPQVIKFRPRQTLANLCEPSREQDEALLRVIAAYEAEGGQVLFPGEGSEEGEAQFQARAAEKHQPLGSEAVTSPAPFVSPRLQELADQVGKRTEDEARAQLNRPRIPQAKGLAQLIAEQTGLDRTFAKLFGG